MCRYLHRVSGCTEGVGLRRGCWVAPRSFLYGGCWVVQNTGLYGAPGCTGGDTGLYGGGHRVVRGGHRVVRGGTGLYGGAPGCTEVILYGGAGLHGGYQRLHTITHDRVISSKYNCVGVVPEL